MPIVKLNSKNLLQLNKNISVPSYSRNGLVPSIIHIGMGNFHKAHQAAYLDMLLEKKLTGMGIYGINLLPDSWDMETILREQDYLYTLITKSPMGEEKLRICGSVISYMNAAGKTEEVIKLMGDKTTKLITLTVTEGGYYYDRISREINSNHPAILEDLKNPAKPKTPAASIAAALALRYKDNKQPLTIMSCDNVNQNGRVLGNCVRFFLKELYPETLGWAEDNVSFPSSMVDRITPAAGGELTKELEEKYAIGDNWPVCAEDYTQWVLEDDFKSEIPPYEDAGVQIVKDVGAYELMKMRLLNGSHSALAYPSYLMGLNMVDQGINDPLIKKFIRNFYMEEAAATLPPVPGIDIEKYKDTLINRFSNTNIADTIARLCARGTEKVPSFIAKTLIDAIRQGTGSNSLIFSLAAWARYLEGKDEDGNEIKITDPNSELLEHLKNTARNKPEAFLSGIGLDELEKTQLEKITAEFKAYLDNIYAKGIKRALEEITA